MIDAVNIQIQKMCIIQQIIAYVNKLQKMQFVFRYFLTISLKLSNLKGWTINSRVPMNPNLFPNTVDIFSRSTERLRFRICWHFMQNSREIFLDFGIFYCFRSVHYMWKMLFRHLYTYIHIHTYICIIYIINNNTISSSTARFQCLMVFGRDGLSTPRVIVSGLVVSRTSWKRLLTLAISAPRMGQSDYDISW